MSDAFKYMQSQKPWKTPAKRIAIKIQENLPVLMLF